MRTKVTNLDNNKAFRGRNEACKTAALASSASRSANWATQVARPMVRSAFAFATLAPVIANAQTTTPLYIEIAQESSARAGDFDCNPLGVLQMFDGSGTAAEFYNYSSSSFGGTLTYGAPLEDFSNLFFVRLGDGSVALTWVQDRARPSGGDGGRTFTNVEVVGSSEVPSWLVQDDTSIADNRDVYGSGQTPSGSYAFAATQVWDNTNTDGYMIGPLAENWTVFAAFQEAPTRLFAWQIIGPDGGYQIVSMDANRRVRMRPVAAPTTTLLQLLTFDDPTDPYRDSSGRNHHAYPRAGDPMLTTGVAGNGVGLDVDNWLRNDLELGPDAHTAITFGGWVRVAAAPTAGANFVSSGDGVGFRDRGLFMTLGDDGQYHWALNRQQNGFGQDGASAVNTRVVVEQNMFVAAVYDESNVTSGTVKLRVNGVSRNDPSIGLMGPGNNWFGIGGNPEQGGTDTPIVVDNFFVMSEALSDARLEEIRLNGYRHIPSCATIFRQPACVCTRAGSAITLSVDAGSSGGVRYLWRKNGVSMGVTTSSLVIAAASESTEGRYDVLVTSLNGCGSVLSSAATVTVSSPGEASCTPCDSIDFNNNSLFPEDQDLIDFFSVLAGGPCSTPACNDIDFNNDGLFPSDDDLIAYLRVLAGGVC